MFRIIIGSYPDAVSENTLRAWIASFFEFIKDAQLPQTDDFTEGMAIEFNDEPQATFALGEHSYTERKIVFYEENITKFAITPSRKVEEYVSVFIHEMFHAYHMQLAKKSGSPEMLLRKDYTKTVVVESLAGFFTNNYRKAHCIGSSKNGDWAGRLPCFDPYSGARYISDWSKFGTILMKSLNNLDSALRTLLPGGAFYDVKNVIPKAHAQPTPTDSKKDDTDSSVFSASALNGSTLYETGRFKGIAAPSLKVMYGNYLKTGCVTQLLIYKDGTMDSRVTRPGQLSPTVFNEALLIDSLRTNAMLKKSKNPRADEIAAVVYTA